MSLEIVLTLELLPEHTATCGTTVYVLEWPLKGLNKRAISSTAAAEGMICISYMYAVVAKEQVSLLRS